MITSLQNATIKHIFHIKDKPKVRKKESLFIMEGIKSIEQVDEDCIKLRVVSQAFAEAYASYMQSMDPRKTRVVSDAVFKHLSDEVTPQGILALVTIHKYCWSDILSRKNPLILILEAVRDPGNMGTIIRTADAVQADGILISKDCVDVYNPKTVRSTMGSICHIPIMDNRAIEKDILELKENNIHIVATHLRGKHYLYDLDMKQPLGLLFGNESRGISKKIADSADQWIKIPMLGRAESLNAGVAASICMYEAIRQRLQQ